MLRPALALVLLVLAAPGCARWRSVAPSPGEWFLLQPPDVDDPNMPGGRRLLPETPLVEWRQQGAFRSAEECSAAKRAEINRTIDHARKASGEANAKYDLSVRRAVHARCVAAAEARSAGPRD